MANLDAFLIHESRRRNNTVLSKKSKNLSTRLSFNQQIHPSNILHAKKGSRARDFNVSVDFARVRDTAHSNTTNSALATSHPPTASQMMPKRNDLARVYKSCQQTAEDCQILYQTPLVTFSKPAKGEASETPLPAKHQRKVENICKKTEVQRRDIKKCLDQIVHRQVKADLRDLKSVQTTNIMQSLQSTNRKSFQLNYLYKFWDEKEQVEHENEMTRLYNREKFEKPKRL